MEFIYSIAASVLNPDISSYLIVSLLSVIISFLYAANTRKALFKIPWFILFFKKVNLIGGASQVLMNLWLVFFWILISLFISLSLFYAFSQLGSFFNINGSSDFLVIVLTLLFQIYFTKNSVDIVLKERENGTYDLQENIYELISPLNQLKSSDGSKYTITIKLSFLIIYLFIRALNMIIPGILLAPLYDRIYTATNMLFDATETLIAEKFKAEEVMLFYEKHSFRKNVRKQIDDVISKCDSSNQKKGVIIRKKLELSGYGPTIHFIQKYKFKRKEVRYSIKKPVPAKISTNIEVDITILNINANGSGIKIESDNDFMEAKQDCLLLYDDRKIPFRSVYKERNNGSIFYGLTSAESNFPLFNMLSENNLI